MNLSRIPDGLQQSTSSALICFSVFCRVLATARTFCLARRERRETRKRAADAACLRHCRIAGGMAAQGRHDQEGDGARLQDGQIVIRKRAGGNCRGRNASRQEAKKKVIPFPI
jgi:hypothetical protein